MNRYYIFFWITFLLSQVGYCEKLKINLGSEDLLYIQPYWETIKIESEDTLISNYLTEGKTNYEYNLPIDRKYTIKIVSKFNHSIDTSIIFSKKTKITINSLHSYYKTNQDSTIFINQLEKEDTLYILYEMQGCFARETGLVTITKTKNKYQGTLVSNGTRKTSPKKITFDKQKLTDIKGFERQLRSIKFGHGCTTSTTYYMNLNRELITVLDGGCTWNGINLLKKKIFEIEN